MKRILGCVGLGFALFVASDVKALTSKEILTCFHSGDEYVRMMTKSVNENNADLARVECLLGVLAADGKPYRGDPTNIATLDITYRGGWTKAVYNMQVAADMMFVCKLAKKNDKDVVRIEEYTRWTDVKDDKPAESCYLEHWQLVDVRYKE